MDDWDNGLCNHSEVCAHGLLSKFKNEIVRAYAQDHFFDVITNSVGLVAAVLAIRYYCWIDPTGAIIVFS